MEFAKELQEWPLPGDHITFVGNEVRHAVNGTPEYPAVVFVDDRDDRRTDVHQSTSKRHKQLFELLLFADRVHLDMFDARPNRKDMRFGDVGEFELADVWYAANVFARRVVHIATVSSRLRWWLGRISLVKAPDCKILVLDGKARFYVEPALGVAE